MSLPRYHCANPQKLISRRNPRQDERGAGNDPPTILINGHRSYPKRMLRRLSQTQKPHHETQ